jgi:hypothetical protein
MCKLLASAFVGLALAFALCGGFAGTASAQASGGPARARIMHELDMPTEMDFVETPLKCVVEALKIRHGIEIKLDEKAITDAGVNADTPITESLKGISLKSALRLMLQTHELSFIVDHEVLLITTEGKTELQLYDVADLLGKGGSTDELIRAVSMALPRSMASPEAGRDNGGRGRRGGSGPIPNATDVDGEIAYFRGVLLVRTTVRGHMNIEIMLEELRDRINSQKEHGPTSTSQDRSHDLSAPLLSRSR